MMNKNKLRMDPIHLQPKNQKKIFEEGDFLDKKVKYPYEVTK